MHHHYEDDAKAFGVVDPVDPFVMCHAACLFAAWLISLGAAWRFIALVWLQESLSNHRNSALSGIGGSMNAKKPRHYWTNRINYLTVKSRCA
jgi:hypothetical protein